MSKRIVSTLMALVMALSLLPVQVLAAGADYPTDEDTAVRTLAAGNADITGTGTAEDPYLIYTAAGLKAFRDKVVNGENGALAMLMNDIVLNDGTFDENGNWSEDGTPNQWTPIGSSSSLNPYKGTFDGDGYTIKGLYVTGVEKAGLFGYAGSATIKNVTVDGYVEGMAYVGGIAGYSSGSRIENCVNLCRVATTAMSTIVGGIAGFSDAGEILSCANLGAVSVSPGDGQFAYTGGITGGASGATVTDCYNAGKVMSLGKESEDSIGGIVGTVDGTATITNCYNAGEVIKKSTSPNCRIGGIAGYQSNNGTISNCYWLSGTANSAVGNNNGGTLTDSAAKSKNEFSDGTVLGLLKQNGTNNAWGNTCGYIAAVDMVLPMFSWQTADIMDITGSGASDDPYLIYTAAGLKQFRDMANGGHGGAHAKLMNDIVLNDGTFDDDGNYTKGASGKDAETWGPIGWLGNAYRGTFDGNGHTIRGLYVVGGTFAGLFHTLYGTVKNLTVTGYVSGTGTAGGIASQGGIFENCVNQCRVIAKHGAMTEAWAGGIVGCGGTAQNCVNMGRITSCSGYGVAFAGGLVGQGSAVGCYNVGKVDGSGGYLSRIGGITGHGNAENCYWLEGTAEKAVGSSGGVAANTKADFADGTVLELLKNNRTDSPWADECQYLAAAGMTLPVFKGQGDSHTHSEKTGNCLGGIYCECGYLMHMATSEHNWGEWQHLTTSHTRTCNNPGCGMTQSGNCSGGTATCIEQATCEVCHEKYGALKAHSFTAENTDAQYLKTAATCTTAAVYYKSCAVCGEKGTDTFTSGGPKGHSWGAWTSNGNDTHTRRCTVTGCTASETASCSGGTATCVSAAVCTVCGQTYGNKDAGNHDLKRTAAKEPGVFVSGHIEYWQCSACGKYFADANGAKEISQSDTIIPRRRRTADSEGGKASPDTFDAGIGICAVTAVTSLAGLTLLRRKRRDSE